MADIITITDSNGRINNNIPKKLFRLSTENKNLLAKAGSLYYGTGDTETATIKLADGPDQTYQIPITKAVEPPNGGIKNGVYYGIKFHVRNDQTIESAQMIGVEPPKGGIKNDVHYGIRFHVRNDQTIETAQMIAIPFTPLVVGVYLWNDYLSEPSNWSMQDVNFVYTTTSGASVKCTAIQWDTYKLYYIPEDAPDNPIQVYSYDEGEGPESGIWENPGYKTINFSTTPQLVSEAFYWDFITDATQQ